MEVKIAFTASPCFQNDVCEVPTGGLSGVEARETAWKVVREIGGLGMGWIVARLGNWSGMWWGGWEGVIA